MMSSTEKRYTTVRFGVVVMCFEVRLHHHNTKPHDFISLFIAGHHILKSNILYA
jgi:hypothetical protein